MDEQNIRILAKAPQLSRVIPFPRDFLKKTVAERFEYVVKSSPQSVAVNDMGEEYTYQEINFLANSLAKEIFTRQKRFGNQENAVGLILGHNVDTIIGPLSSVSIYLPNVTLICNHFLLQRKICYYNLNEAIIDMRKAKL